MEEITISKWKVKVYNDDYITFPFLRKRIIGLQKNKIATYRPFPGGCDFIFTDRDKAERMYLEGAQYCFELAIAPARKGE